MPAGGEPLFVLSAAGDTSSPPPSWLLRSLSFLHTNKLFGVGGGPLTSLIQSPRCTDGGITSQCRVMIMRACVWLKQRQLNCVWIRLSFFLTLLLHCDFYCYDYSCTDSSCPIEFSSGLLYFRYLSVDMGGMCWCLCVCACVHVHVGVILQLLQPHESLRRRSEGN